jgi:hypothetical protein
MLDVMLTVMLPACLSVISASGVQEILTTVKFRPE